MRRKPSSTSTARIDPDNDRRRRFGGLRAPGNLHCRPRPADVTQVVDDFRDVMPVSQRELDVIETYLGAVLDDMLKRTE
jgi:hypothetical protein